MDRLKHFGTPAGQFDLFFGFLLVVISLTASISIALSDDPSYQEIARPVGPLWILLIVPGVAVMFRRIAPIGALAVGTIATTLVWMTGLPEFTLSAAVLAYSAVVHGRESRGLHAGLASAVFLTLFTCLGVAVDEVPFYVIGLVALTGATAVALGANVRAHEAHTLTLEQRAQDAEQRREVEELSIRVRERNRIARELHDVVAHGLSVIVVQAGGAQRVLESDPDCAREAVGQIERTARDSLNEMRHVLGVLRAEEDEVLRPTPGLTAIEELVQDFVASDLPVDYQFHVDGEPLTVGWPPDPPLPVNAALDTTAYRIVQEALTNVLKHGGTNARAWVTIDAGQHGLTIKVSDNGRGLAADPNDGGWGLRGMRERVEVFGGTLRSGGRPGGGFQITAELPLEGMRV